MVVLRDPTGIRDGNLQGTRLFEIVGVGDEVRSFLRGGAGDHGESEEQTQASNPEQEHDTPFASHCSRRSPERFGLRQGKPSATLRRNVAHGLGLTVSLLDVAPPGRQAPRRAFSVPSKVTILRLSLNIAR